MAAKARRWNYFKDRLIEQFGEVVYKVGIDAGFTCPNRDGTKAWGGCAYCSQIGSLSPQQDPNLEIPAQIKKGQGFARRRYKAQKYIVYYQAFTNTYAPVEVLRQRFEAALVDDSIVGMSVATRPDCVNEENAAYMAELSRRLPYFTVELGLQSAYQNRLEWVNRQESVEDFIKAMEILRRHGVKVVTHVILGFPGESLQDMLDTALLADREGSYGIKLQMLHVIKGTKLAHIHAKEPLSLMSMEEYGEAVLHIVERLNPKLEIHRITGETESSQLVAPDWVKFKTKFFAWFDAELERRDTYQGRLYAAPEAAPQISL
ncbi:MAG: TIGR01212 family radical SAM protein [Bdellovibrionales bacterium]|nr:TIGR01212 family radical SAM protein [Bdellovibrionales bacterium]